MATFDPVQDGSRLDWRILVNSAVARYTSRTILEGDLGWLTAAGYFVHRSQCDSASHSREVVEALLRAIAPARGHEATLAGVSDALAEMCVPLEGGRAIVLEGADEFFRQQPDEARELLTIIEIESRRHLLYGRCLLCLILIGDPTIEVLPFGAAPARWNPKERVGSYGSKGNSGQAL